MPDAEETLLEFPCDFPIKAIGPAGSAFEILVIELVRSHAPDLDVETIKVRASSGGKWASVTVTVRATSKQQLDAIYQELTDHEMVKWAL